MLSALIRSRFELLFSSMFRSSRGTKKRSVGFKILIGILVVYVVGCFLFLFGGTFYGLAEPLRSAGLSWFYFGFAALSSAALCFIGSVFMAQQQLFSAKDNDLLLSLPIPPSYILAARMMMLLGLNYLFELCVMVPAGAVWCYVVGASARGVVVFIVCCIFLPLIPLTLSCLFGWLLAVVSDRIRNKSIVTVVLSLAFLAAYFYFFGNLNRYISELIASGAALANSVGSVYPIWAFGSAIADGSVSGLLGFLACCAVPFGIAYAVLSRFFIAVATSKRGAKKLRYREKSMRAGGVRSALLAKELRHFAANGMYIMNAALGSIFSVAAAVAVFIYAGKVREFAAMAGLTDSLGTVCAAALCLLGAMDFISAPSLSLEGKSLWIVRSLPVTPYQILRSKVDNHVLLSLPPVVLAGVCAAIALKLSPLGAAAALLAPAAMSVFCAYIGIVVNLHFPKFDYISDVAVVKQSASTMISMLVGWAAIAAPAALYMLVLSGHIAADVFTLIFSAALGVLCLVMDSYLRRGGTRRFEAL